MVYFKIQRVQVRPCERIVKLNSETGMLKTMQQRHRRALVVFGILSVPSLTLLMMLAAHGQAPRVRKITFVSNRDGNNEIYVMDANGRNPRRLTNNAAADRTPAWSPNGQRIAFTSDRDGKGLIEIYIMDADGNNPRKLTDSIGINTNPSWSPGGSKIVFQSSRDRKQRDLHTGS